MRKGLSKETIRPAIAVNGGFSFEDQIFKALPWVPLCEDGGNGTCTDSRSNGRKTIGLSIEAQQVPVYIERFGSSKEEIL